MSTSLRIERLIRALRCLPGVGPKSAQRIAFHLLERDRDGALELSHALEDATKHVGHCQSCRTLSDSDLCGICTDDKREHQSLCIVESPADVNAIENATGFRGLYYVLMGHLSPLDGIGPEEIGLDKLEERIAQGEIVEVIIATNPTVEGEATAHYINEIVQPYHIKVSRIAHGIPMGGELEYIDGTTLSHAFHGRVTVK
jgi:recombination protein RecR